VQRHIVPQLRPWPQEHSVVVMDRASIHFRADIIELIERRGARVFACAPHCPWVGLDPRRTLALPGPPKTTVPLGGDIGEGGPTY